jgi:hypothetical protein
MTKIINADFIVLGETTLAVNNATGEFLTIDGAGVIRKRTAGETLTDIGAAPLVHIHTYVHTQALPSATWSINHALGKFPSVTIVNTSGDEVEGDVNHIDNNNVEINFSAAFGGVAYLN